MTFEEQKNVFVTAKNKIGEWLNGRNTIDRLMTDKVDDFYLTDEQPMPIMVGGKTIYVGNMTYNNYKYFLVQFAKIMANIGTNIINMDILANGMDLSKALLMNNKLHKDMCKLIKKTILNQQDYYYRELSGGQKIKIKLPKCSLRFFLNNITIEKMVQILLLIYLYNFDSVKKNFKIMGEKMGLNQLTETYMWSWLKNCTGMTGKFFVPQLANLGFIHKDFTKELETQTKAKKASSN